MPVNLPSRRTLLADLSLLLVALFWGSNFVVVKDALDTIAPFTYLGWRFTLAAVILILLFARRLSRACLRDLLGGTLAGLFLFGGFALQTVGLIYTTPAKSGFITGIYVVMVPFLYIFVNKSSPGWRAFAGGFLAVSGLYFLSITSGFSLELGDLLTLLCALFFAAHIITLGAIAPEGDSLVISILQLGTAGIISFLAAFWVESATVIRWDYPLEIWGAIFYAVIFCTIGAFVTQTIAQRHTPSTHAALILCLESVFAGLFSYLFWGEVFTARKLLGIVLIFAAIIVTELKVAPETIATASGQPEKTGNHPPTAE